MPNPINVWVALARSSIPNRVRAASQYRSTVRAMHKTGIIYRDTGVLLGISHQRVSQLIAESK